MHIWRSLYCESACNELYCSFVFCTLRRFKIKTYTLQKPSTLTMESPRVQSSGKYSGRFILPSNTLTLPTRLRFANSFRKLGSFKSFKKLLRHFISNVKISRVNNSAVASSLNRVYLFEERFKCLGWVNELKSRRSCAHLITSSSSRDVHFIWNIWRCFNIFLVQFQIINLSLP